MIGVRRQGLLLKADPSHPHRRRGAAALLHEGEVADLELAAQRVVDEPGELKEHELERPRLRRIRRIPRAGRSRLGLVGCGRRRGRAGGGAEQDRIELGVELGEPRVLAPQLLHPLLVLHHSLLVRDLPLLVFSPELLALVLQLLLPPIELDLSQLVVDDGSPVEHRQTAPEPGQRGVVLRFADQG